MESSDAVEPIQDTPGARLRAAREMAGLTPREMSDRLNWLPAHVTAIEENRFDELRGAAFIRGYLRAYARSVGLDEDEIVALYTAMFPPEDEPSEPVTATAVESQKAGWSVVFGTAVAVLVIGWIWWQQQQAPEVAAPVDEPAVAVEPQAPDATAGAQTVSGAAPVDATPEPEIAAPTAAAEAPEPASDTT